MKIVLLSDIHANLPALESVLEDMERHAPDLVLCLGDLVGYATWPNEVIRLIRKHRIPTIAGNYDQGVGLHGDDCGCAYKTDSEKANGRVSIAYTNESIDESSRAYLRTLPAHMNLEFQLNEGEKLNLLLVHGSPRKINEYLFEDRDEKSLRKIMESANADIMAFGHTHKPYHRILDEGDADQKNYRHAINTGSVGKPKDNDPRACYVVLTIDNQSSKYSQESVKVEFIRVTYDVERAAKAIEQSALPNEFAEMLRKGN